MKHAHFFNRDVRSTGYFKYRFCVYKTYDLVLFIIKNCVPKILFLLKKKFLPLGVIRLVFAIIV